MEQEKNLLQDIRSSFAMIKDRVDALKDLGVDLTIEVGANSKTVTFEKVTVFEMNVKAKVQQDL
jgi:hypothetical protein